MSLLVNIACYAYNWKVDTNI